MVSFRHTLAGKVDAGSGLNYGEKAVLVSISSQSWLINGGLTVKSLKNKLTHQL